MGIWEKIGIRLARNQQQQLLLRLFTRTTTTERSYDKRRALVQTFQVVLVFVSLLSLLPPPLRDPKTSLRISPSRLLLIGREATTSQDRPTKIGVVQRMSDSRDRRLARGGEEMAPFSE